VRVQLDSPDRAGVVRRADAQASRLVEQGRVTRVHAVVAAVRLLRRLLSVDGPQSGAVAKVDRFGVLDQAARKARDQGAPGIRVNLRVVGAGPSEDIAGVFDDGVLEPATGSKERAAGLTREADRRQGPVAIGVGTTRNTPDAGVPFERLDARHRERPRVHPGGRYRSSDRA
jgi:hypothetical protein